jgi:hypothetical protein
MPLTLPSFQSIDDDAQLARYVVAESPARARRSPPPQQQQRRSPSSRRRIKSGRQPDRYAVEHIHAWRGPGCAEVLRRKAHGQPVPHVEFFVQWEGYGCAEGQWLSERDFAGGADAPMVRDFLAAHPEPFAPDWLRRLDGEPQPGAAEVDTAAAIDELPLSVLPAVLRIVASDAGVAALRRLASSA